VLRGEKEGYENILTIKT